MQNKFTDYIIKSMKKIIASFLIVLAMFVGVASVAEAKTVRVKSYYKPSTGRYVAPHHKTSPNKTRFDNYSTKGNHNPYTGKKGYTNPYGRLR